jgi:cytochrome P450
MMGETWVVLASPDSVRELFAQKPDRVDSGAANIALRPVLGTQNVLLLDGEEHLRRRRLVLGPFHGDALRSYPAIIEHATSRELASWPLGRPFRALERLESLTYSVILQVVFGDEHGDPRSALGLQLGRLLRWTTDWQRALLFMLLGSERLTRLPAYRQRLGDADRVLLELIERRRRDPSLGERRDVLSHLLSAQEQGHAALSSQDIRDELVTLVVAGHQTMTGVLGWAIHDLARSPAHLDRLAEEGADFALAVVRETMRLHPVVPVAGIRRLKVPLVIAGRCLPAGVTVAPCTALVHRRVKDYPDPQAFRPERFAGARPQPGAWFPFGGGGRRCLGAGLAEQEMSLVLSGIAARFSLRAQGHKERVGRRGVVLVPASGARIVAHTRTAGG